jgi:hypothetical protein
VQNKCHDKPVVQESFRRGHLELELPMLEETVVIDDETARQLADDIERVVDGHDA